METLKSGLVINPEHISAVVQAGPNKVAHLIGGQTVVLSEEDAAELTHKDQPAAK
jgi:hypothetical protein